MQKSIFESTTCQTLKQETTPVSKEHKTVGSICMGSLNRRLEKMLASLISFDFCCNIQMARSKLGTSKHESMDPSSFVSTAELQLVV